MKTIEIKLSVDAVAPLLDLMREIADELKTTPCLRPDIVQNSAKELGDFWHNELIAGQTDDCQKFLSMFGSEFFAEGRIQITPDKSEPILRASAAIRLRLRATRLEKIGEEEIRKIQNSPDAPKEPNYKPVVAYLLLAEIQSILLRHLNPLGEDSGN